jgi:hypothetical protein
VHQSERNGVRVDDVGVRRLDVPIGGHMVAIPWTKLRAVMQRIRF